MKLSLQLSIVLVKRLCGQCNHTHCKLSLKLQLQCTVHDFQNWLVHVPRRPACSDITTMCKRYMQCYQLHIRSDTSCIRAVANSTTCDCMSCVSAVYDEEMLVVQLQNDLAKLEVDILHTHGHNVRLEQAMKLLNEDISEKMQTIGKLEVGCNCISSNAPFPPALQASGSQV